MADPRINIVINDARNALRLTRKSYDAIVSQPSHPWTAGASHLFTREFAADVRSHLNEGGVFLQWMNGEFVDEPLLRTLAATLLAEFQYVRLYRPSSRVLMFLASEAPLDVELALARTGRPIADDVMHFSRFGIISVEDLLASLAMDEQGILSFARGAEISTDDNNLMATRSRFRADGLTADDMLELFEPYDPLVRAGSWVHTRLAGAIDYGYLARRLVSIGQAPRATALAAAIPDFSRQFEVYGLMFELTGQGDQAPESFANALVANPLNLQARYAGIRGYLDVLSRGEAPEDIQQIAAGLSGPAAAAIRGLAYEAAAEWASLALIEQVLIIESNENLHTMRAAAAGTLGDANRLVESSQYLAEAINSYLTTFANEQYTISAEQLEQVRANLTVIGDNIAGDLDVVDPQRLAAVRDNVNTLIQFVDDYSP